MRDQLLYQYLLPEAGSKQWLDYIESFFSAYIDAFIVLSVIVLVSIAWLCASELKSKPIASKPVKPKTSTSFLSSYERMMEDSSSIC